MPIRNILVPICPGVDFDHQLDAALRLARRLEAHVNAVYIRPDPVAAPAVVPEMAIAAGATPDPIDRESREAEAGSHAKFEVWRAKHDLPSGMVDQLLRTPFAFWSERFGPIEQALIRCGRLSDLIVLNFPGSYMSITERAFHAAVFDTARPTILLPRTIPDDLLRHVVVAWNGSIQATRAVAGAMDLLHAAEQVTVFNTPSLADDSFGDLDLPEFLTWHGIHARSFAPRPGEQLVGTAMLRVAAQCEATMLVMGSYSQRRVRQFDIGGITNHVLQYSEIPVLMMH